MTSTSGPEDAEVERAEEQGGYGSPTPEQEAGQGAQAQGGAGQSSQAQSSQAQSSQAQGDDEDDEATGEHDVD